jgi:hypothetical protein
MSKSNKSFTDKCTVEFEKKKPWNRSWNAPKVTIRKKPKRKLPPKTTEGFK